MVQKDCRNVSAHGVTILGGSSYASWLLNKNMSQQSQNSTVKEKNSKRLKGVFHHYPESGYDD